MISIVSQEPTVMLAMPLHLPAARMLVVGQKTMPVPMRDRLVESELVGSGRGRSTSKCYS
jgi:hypothetical protein